MNPPTPKKRGDIQKQHYWLQLDLLVRAETMESALKRAGMLFRKAYRNKLVLDALVYMGAHSARCRGSLSAKRTNMHPTVKLTKGLPIIPGQTLAEVDAAVAEKVARKAKRVPAREQTAPEVITPTPGTTTKPASVPDRVPIQKKPAGKGVTKPSRLAGLFGK